MFDSSSLDFWKYFFLTKKNENVEETSYNVSEFQKKSNWYEEYMQYKNLHEKTEGKSQIIALIDSGVSNFQKSQVERNYNMLSNVDTFDENGHGTMMCSLILGGDQLLGIAPKSKIYSYKVVDESGKVAPQILAKAIDKAVQDKVTIINISLGSYFNNKKVKKAINNAANLGITIVASSGDYNTEDMLYPAKYKCCISVGAMDKKMNVWENTNAKDKCDILAPGVNVKTILNTRELVTTSGTSQATALISGYVALIKDYAIIKGINVTNEQIKELIQKINNKKITYLEGLEELK